MNNVTVSCPNCANPLLLPESDRGQMFRCPQCKSSVTAAVNPAPARRTPRVSPAVLIVGGLCLLWISGMTVAAFVTSNQISPEKSAQSGKDGSDKEHSETGSPKKDRSEKDRSDEGSPKKGNSEKDGKKDTAPRKCLPVLLARTPSVQMVKLLSQQLANAPAQLASLRHIFKGIQPGGNDATGVAHTKLFGLYACPDPVNIGANEVVLMIPLADREKFDTYLKTNVGYSFKKKGTWSRLELRSAGSTFVHYANDYAYFILTASELLPRFELLKPSEMKVSDSNQLAVNFYFDRYPTALLERALSRAKGTNYEFVAAYAKSLFRDGKEVSFTVDLDAKNNRLVADGRVTVKPKSDLHLALRQMNESKSVTVGLPKANAVMHASVHFRLPKKIRQVFLPGKKDFPAILPGMAKPMPEHVRKQFLDVIFPTIDAGELDFAVAVAPTSGGKKLAVLTGLKWVQAKKLEAMLRKEAGVQVQFDVAKIDNVSVHRAKTTGGFPPQLAQAFDVENTYVVFRDDAVFMATGNLEDALKWLKHALDAKSQPAPLLNFELINCPGTPGFQPFLPKNAAFRLSITGGDFLRVRAELPVQVQKMILGF